MTSPELARWLKTATQGLPVSASERLRTELTDHYLDAYEYALEEGHDDAHARHLALESLGNARAISDEYQQTYHTRRRYRLAAAIGMSYPIFYGLSIAFNESVAGHMAFNLALFLPLLYIVYAFKTILAVRPHGAPLYTYEQLIHTGIVAVCVPRLFGWVIYHHPIVVEASSRSFSDIRSPAELLMNGMALIGLFLTAGGFLLLGERALRVRESLYGLLKPSAILGLVCGLGLGVYGLGTLGNNMLVRGPAEELAVFSGMLSVVVWSMIFFRAQGEIRQVA
jgi:hypothetical protein